MKKKIDSIETFKNKLRRTVSSFILVSMLVFFILLMFVTFINESIQRSQLQKDILTANNLLQSNISNIVTTMINQQSFSDYFHAGEVTRRENQSIITWMVYDLRRYSPISGIKLLSNKREVLDVSGNVTNFYTELPLCYLGSVYDTDGTCQGSIILYFDKNKYIKSLSMYNLNIQPSSKFDNKIDLVLLNKKFGSFNATNFQTQPIKVYYKKTYSNLVLILLIISTITLIIISYISRFLTSITNRYFVEPLQYLTNALEEGRTLTTTDNNLRELNLLIEVVNTYQQQALNKKLFDISAQVAHDIRDPIDVSRRILLSLKKTYQDTNLDELDVQLEKLYNITQEVLISYRTFTSVENSYDISRLMVVNVHESISRTIDSISYKDQCCITFNNKNKNIFIKIKPLKFERILTNIINNAFESYTTYNTYKAQEKKIDVNLELQSNNVLITIQDFGIGVPSNEIDNILNKGKSLKHAGKGMGLKPTKDYLLTLGGDTDFKSQPNIGSTIKLVIPICKENIFINKDDLSNIYSNFIVIEPYFQDLAQWQNILLNSQQLYLHLDIEELTKNNYPDDTILILHKSYYKQYLEHNYSYSKVYIIGTYVDYYLQEILLPGHTIVIK